MSLGHRLGLLFLILLISLQTYVVFKDRKKFLVFYLHVNINVIRKLQV